MTVTVRTNLPRHEADGLDDRRLHDLLAREHTPGDSVGTIRVTVGAEVTMSVDHVVGDVVIPFNNVEEKLKELGVDEELEVSLRIVGQQHCSFQGKDLKSPSGRYNHG